ncbi:CopG family transcriptional regulator [Acidobacteriota bacterium]
MDSKDIKLTVTEALYKKIEETAAGQGKSAADLIVELLNEKFPVEAGMSKEEEDKVKERLKALGYMD